MKIKNIIFSCTIFGCGLFIGILLSEYKHKKKTNYCGNLRLDRSDGDLMMYLEFNNGDLETLKNSEDAIFKIIKKNYLA